MLQSKRNNKDADIGELVEKVVHVSRVAKVVKGGRRFSFSALIVVGNKKGKVGIGLGKASEVPEAIRKGAEQAKRNIVDVFLCEKTIPHDTVGKHGAGCVVMKPASEGTGVIAGGAVRSVIEAVGISDVLIKSIGSRNPHNAVRATINGLLTLRTHDQQIKRLGLNNDKNKSS